VRLTSERRPHRLVLPTRARWPDSADELALHITKEATYLGQRG
jgi:hypothetical protein